MSRWILRVFYLVLACAAVVGVLSVLWRVVTWGRYAPDDVCLEPPASTVEPGPHVWPGFHQFPLYYQCSYPDEATGLWRNTTQGWEYNWIALASLLALIAALVLFLRDRRLSRVRKGNPET